MSWSLKWIWKPETPGSEPAGARISAGKSGSVERSLPSSAVSLVKRDPVELHAVAGVAGEADDDAVDLLDGLGHRGEASSGLRRCQKANERDRERTNPRRAALVQRRPVRRERQVNPPCFQAEP